VVSFTSLPLCPRGNSPRHPLDRRLVGPQSRSGRCGVEKDLLPGIQPRPSRPYLVAFPTELSQLTRQLCLIQNSLHVLLESFTFPRCFRTPCFTRYIFTIFLHVKYPQIYYRHEGSHLFRSPVGNGAGCIQLSTLNVCLSWHSLHLISFLYILCFNQCFL
jgi:hypothetical protein